MSTPESLRNEPRALVDGKLVVIVGSTAPIHLAAAALEADGVSAVAVEDGAAAATHCPDLVVIGCGDEHGQRDDQALREIRDRHGEPPPMIAVGRGLADNHLRTSRDIDLPADVNTDELAEHARAALGLPSPRTKSRSAVPEEDLRRAADREVRLSRISERPGLLARIGVAELAQLNGRFGPHGRDALNAAFDELIALDAHVLEQHSADAEGFWLLIPESDPASGSARLRAMSRRISTTVIDVEGEQVRVTPVTGFANFAGASSEAVLFAQADTALQSAFSHLDLLPVEFTPSLPQPSSPSAPEEPRWIALAARSTLALQIVFTLVVLLSVPFLAYVAAWRAGIDITVVAYPLVALALTGTAAALWVEGLRAVGRVDPPAEPAEDFPPATAIVAAYLPNEAATIVETLTNQLGQDYPGELQVILAYNSPEPLPVEETLAELAASDPRLLILRVSHSTSKAQNINSALAHVNGEFVGIFDADHHPAPGSFSRAWRWLSQGHDVVQGHCVVRNGGASWVARLIAVEFETIYAVSHPGRARLHGFGIFGGSNGYWRRDALRQIRMQQSMLTEDIDSSMRSLQSGFSIVSDPALVSTELAPLTLRAVWNQRMRWAQGWTQTAWKHLRPALASPHLNRRQKVGAAFLLGWAQIVPWITVQVIPILAFTAWREGGFGKLHWVVPLFLILTFFTFTAGAIQILLAYLLGDREIRRRPSWFALYAFHSLVWFGEFKNVIVRVAQLKELIGEHQWRVTPRGP